MKRLLLLTMAILLINGVVFAQPDLGSIDVFSDPGFSSCDFTDAANVFFSVFVVVTHSGAGQAAAQWMMTIPSAWQFLGSQSPFQTVIGDPLGGISIAYGACMTGDFLILTVNFLGDGLSTACSLIKIVPDPSVPSGQIEIVDCQFPNEQKWPFASLGAGIVNDDGSCPCTYVPVQETTWGGIKALYE